MLSLVLLCYVFCYQADIYDVPPEGKSSLRTKFPV